MGEDTDTPNLVRILGLVRGRCNIDPAKLLLTGMSDGGTFCYVTGLESTSPFTHLAPVSATFHPLMAEMADAEGLRACRSISCMAGSTGCFRCRSRGRPGSYCRRRAPTSPIANSTISAIAIRAK